jgi:signal transduction histidine kinase
MPQRKSNGSDNVVGQGVGGFLRKEVDDAPHDINPRLASERTGPALADPSVTETTGSRKQPEFPVLTPQEFVAMTGHDLRNDLAVLSINAALLQKNAERNALRENDHPFLRNMNRILAHMDHLVSDLLELTRIDTGKLEIRPKYGDAAQVIRESVESFHPIALAKSVELRAAIPDSELPARIDARRIHQVMSNLLANAIKFTPTPGRVHVVARRDDGFVVVEVHDSGTGIPAGQLDVIFERYAQLKDLHGEGLGLGLYIARWIVEAHGGKIWARSRAGGGSTFGFCVPGATGETRPGN